MMSRGRFNAVYSGMTSIARKVYEAVPAAERWQATQIAAELQRSGTSADFRIVSGCLNTLKGAGLVTESGCGGWQREAIREQATKSPTTENTMANKSAAKPAATPAPKKTAPIDRLGELAQRVAQLSDVLKTLASDVGDAAIDIQAQFEAKEDDVKKLRQLQALLKSLGADAVTE